MTHLAMRMAAVPVTWGVAMLVPVMLRYVPPTPSPNTCAVSSRVSVGSEPLARHPPW